MKTRCSDWTYRMTVDDNIIFLEELAKKTYCSLFDQPYLAFWREMHQKFGLKVHLNIHGRRKTGFYIGQMPDKYKPEWIANSGWIRLTFHSMGNVEDHIKYKDSSYDEVKRDYLELAGNIKRFAGEEVISPFTTIHGAAMSKDGCRALRDCGVRGLGGGTWRARSGELARTYYLNEVQLIETGRRGIWKDPELDLYFIKFDVILHDLHREEIAKSIQSVLLDSHHWSHIEVTFEEWAFDPASRQFHPDAKEKVETALSWLEQYGIKSIFLEEIL